MRALIDLGNKINVMHFAYAMMLDFYTRKIDIGVPKIDAFYLDTFGIVIAYCSIKNKLKKIRFFQKTFLLTNISPKVVLGMLFLIFNRVDI